MDSSVTSHESHSQQAVTVHVNKHDVQLPKRKVSGLEIKEASIRQGVAIELTFSLFRITGSHQHLVKDTDEITVHEDEEFRCVRGDDNS